MFTVFQNQPKNEKKKQQIKDQHSQWLNPYFIKEEHYLKKKYTITRISLKNFFCTTKREETRALKIVFFIK